MQEKEEKYTQLYKTQDIILDLVAKENLDFYLTGGTALQRFHYNQFRFSDDLDFFLINNGIKNHTPKEFNDFTNILKDNNIDFEIKVSNQYFTQLYIKENNLKIDLVNDYVFHEKNDYVKLENGLFIDSIQNIFVNKLETSLSRDEPRDLFDIYTILTNNKMDIEKSFDILIKKTNIDPKDIISHLKNIDFNRINYEEINAKNNIILKDFLQNFHKTIDENFNSYNKKQAIDKDISNLKKNLQYYI
ncbi:nucleotidyl transferase AbiEii/AbiGii toxin family protein, partial [Campylobacter sp. TTU-622]|uniref:nucleotidyl transferase AbiEii/AbiGii toxin family protein n=1 Tax=Campylobacter sp. TTU-622 TaxID=2800583 RepID=UPI001907F5EC